ncbi:MAG: MFS transporter [Acidimicrobiales bacterium]
MEVGPFTASPGGDENKSSAALATVCVILFLTFLDNTVVSVILGNIQSALHAGVTELQWVVDGYAVAFAALMLFMGSLGDLLGRKKVMLAGAAVFCIGSIVCALAPNAGTLIGGRVIMGVGAAASEPGTLSMIRHLYPQGRDRARALGVWAAVSALALALGPVIGGVLVGIADWRAVFWFNLAFGLVALLAAIIVLPENSDPEGRRLDVPGSVLATVALATAIFAVIEGEIATYHTWWVLVCFVAAVVAGVAFVLREIRAPDPLLDLSFVRMPTFSGPNYVAFAVYFGTFAVFFFTALYLEVIVGYSGYRTALQFVFLTAAMVIAALVSGRVTGAWGPRWPMTAGSLLAGVGLLLTLYAISPHPSFGQLAWRLALVGFGFGLAIVPMTSAVLGVVPPERSGMAASATNTSREIGAVFGAAVLGAIINSQLTNHIVETLHKLGLPPNVISIAITTLEHGGLSTVHAQAGASAAAAQSGHPTEVQTLIHAAYAAFYSGLSIVLILSAVLVFVAAVVALVTVARWKPAPEENQS